MFQQPGVAEVIDQRWSEEASQCGAAHALGVSVKSREGEAAWSSQDDGRLQATYAARMSSRHQTVGALFTNAAPGLYTPARYDARNLVTLCERAPALVRIKGAWPAILLAMLKKADDSSYDVQATVIKRSYTFGSQRCAPMLQTLRYCNYISHIAHSRRHEIEGCIPQGRPYRRI